MTRAVLGAVRSEMTGCVGKWVIGRRCGVNIVGQSCGSGTIDRCDSKTV